MHRLGGSVWLCLQGGCLANVLRWSARTGIWESAQRCLAEGIGSMVCAASVVNITATLFDVDKFKSLLASHLCIVKSIMKGLREGFWPLEEEKRTLNLKR
jgi:hypothetical protein